MIEKSSLPEWLCLVISDGCSSQKPFEHSDPSSQFEIIRPGDKEMEVIRHYHISAEGDVVLGVRQLGKASERIGDQSSGKQLPAPISAQRYKINRIAWKQAREPRWSPGVSTHPVAAALWAASGFNVPGRALDANFRFAERSGYRAFAKTGPVCELLI